MKIDLLVIPGCPHHQGAATMLRQALDRIGQHAQTINVTVITNQVEATEHNFPGSPTILINGTDPFAEPSQRPAFACRVYPGGRGVPDAAALREALEEATAAEKPTATA